MKVLKNENMLRIRDLKLLNRLQEMYDNTKFTSANEFYNSLLKSIAYKEIKEDEIIDKLEDIEDKTNAIYEKVKKI